MIFIDGLDTEKGIATMRGKTDKYLKLLAVFEKDVRKKLPDMANALANSDLISYTTHTHAIKSAAAYIGANKLAEASRHMENASKNDDKAYIAANSAGYVAYLDEILTNIRAALMESTPQDRQAPIDLQKLTLSLDGLKRGLADYDLDEIDKHSDALEAFASHADIGSQIEKIMAHKILGEYEEAATAIDAILSGLSNR